MTDMATTETERELMDTIRSLESERFSARLMMRRVILNPDLERVNQMDDWLKRTGRPQDILRLA